MGHGPRVAVGRTAPDLIVTPERWQQIKAVLAVALELDAAHRVAYLDQACLHDDDLREDVDRLLRAESVAGARFLPDPPPAVDRTADMTQDLDHWIGRRVGAYQLVEQIGAGGMGTVYRGIRADDQYHSQVAVKIVHATAGSPFVNRFKTERQILATLDHTNIARLLDGGTTGEGVPYLVMELIEGQPVDVYCETLGLSVGDRLKLFLQICSAVQYAHQRLIVHRDLKPTNILVTHGGVPKLLDFGIAKLLHEDGANDVAVTLPTARLLTPEFASPEQVRGDPITTATDVYSLGVILYRLLAGRSPYRLSTHMPHEVARAVCDEEPERPSSVVRRSLEASTGEEVDRRARPRVEDERARKLARHLTGDLDTIVMRALRKEPERRYASAEQLADDISRHLANLPVLARKDTLGYRSAKFLRRHAVGVTVAVTVLGALSSALAVTLRSAAVARGERSRADRRFEDLRQLARSNLFELNDQIERLPGSASARNLLILRSLQYLDKLTTDTGLNRDLQEELAVGYERIAQLQGNFSGVGIGDSQAALESYRKALGIREALTVEHPDDVGSLARTGGLANAYAIMLERTGRTADAFAMAQRSLGLRERIVRLRPSDPAARRDEAIARVGLAQAMGGNGASNSTREIAAAIDQERQALDILAGLPPSDDQQRIKETVQLRLGFHLQKARAFAESARVFDDILASERVRPQVSRVVLGILHNYRGLMFERAGDQERARNEYEVDLVLARSIADADPADLQAKINRAIAEGHVGMQIARLGRPRVGMPRLNGAIEIGERLLKTNPAESFYKSLLVVAYSYQAEIFSGIGDHAAAEAKYRAALAMATDVSRSDPQDLESPLSIAKVHAALGVVLARAARYSDARREFDEARQRNAGLLRLRPGDSEAEYVSTFIRDGAASLDRCLDGQTCRGARLLRLLNMNN
jgi:non-specific serine/threonine protein kinase/serine/threonine-protein kinase